MIMINEKSEKIRAEFYKERKEPVHIIKKDKEFFNGEIVEVEDSFFIINDKKEGEQMVLFNELIRSISKFKDNDKWK